MEMIQTLILLENERKASEMISYAISSINEVYNEWKKIDRRKNAVNIVTTSINKITTIDPATVEFIHEAGKVKLATIIMRCLDLPPWADIESKRVTYRRVYPLLNKVQRVVPNTGTNGNLNDIIHTRFSAIISMASKNKDVFVAYEPSITRRYLKFIFGNDVPEQVVKMQALPIPEDFDTLLDTLKINHDKACAKYAHTS
jgi:hypothetical protein